MKIFLYYIGKARDTHANAMAEEYIKRSTRYATCEMREIHPGRFDPWVKHPAAAKILLDPLGRAVTSAAFIAQVEKLHDMVFVVEQNRDGQMRSLLINELEVDPKKLIKILHYDGTPITARFISGAIGDKIEAEKIVPLRKAVS